MMGVDTHQSAVNQVGNHQPDFVIVFGKLGHGFDHIAQLHLSAMRSFHFFSLL